MEDIVDIKLATDEAADYFLWQAYAMECNNLMASHDLQSKE